MNKEQIIAWAREAGCDEIHVSKVLMGIHFKPESLERFFNMAQAAEREACAKVCDKEANDRSESDHWTGCASYLAHHIRSRGKA